MYGFTGGNAAYYAPGGPGYQQYLEFVEATPVYTGTDPVIYSTDTPALIPQSPAIPQVPAVYEPPPVWFDPQAPLDTEGFNFPSEPILSAPPITSPPPIYDWEAPLDTGGLSFPSYSPPSYSPPVSYVPEFNLEGLVLPAVSTPPAIYEPLGRSSAEPVWFDPQAPLSTEGFNFPDEARTGPLESIGTFIGEALGAVVDVGKFILDNLDIGISYRGDFGGAKTQKAYYKTLGQPAPVILGMPGSAAPTSVRTSVSTSGSGGSPPMTEEERLYREALQQTGADSDKFIMYAGGAYLAYKLLT